MFRQPIESFDLKRSKGIPSSLKFKWLRHCVIHPFFSNAFIEQIGNFSLLQFEMTRLLALSHSKVLCKLCK